jgi:hypothetical protein
VDTQIKKDWRHFCDQLYESGDILFRDTTPRDDVTRATGMRLLSRNIALALQFELENIDSQHPELLHYFDPLRKQGGDNTDALYVGAPINGTDTYRISGHRGNARFMAITMLEDGDTPWGGKVIASLFGKDLVVDEQGNFELILSPDSQPASHNTNWIQTTSDSYRITFRQFFADWLNESPMHASIECVTHTAPPAPPSSALVGERLQKAAHWLRWSTSYWPEQIDKWQAHPNAFYAYGEWDKNTIDATPGGLPLIAYWQLQPDEAMIVQVTPPQADYWAVEFGNYWWESMDYRYRLCSTNCHHAVLEDNGELILVLSHTDPLVPNWLDCSGYPQGYITVRWVGADSYPKPQCKTVKWAELENHLPAGGQTITEAARLQQLRERRLGVVRRFGS